jgi:hypothetical protein
MLFLVIVIARPCQAPVARRWSLVVASWYRLTPERRFEGVTASDEVQ